MAVSVALVPVAHARNGMLHDTRVYEEGDGHRVVVEFESRVNYLRHFPYSVATVLQIQLRAEPVPGGGVVEVARRRDSLAPATRIDEPLSFITYEGDVPGGPYLVVRFKWPVAFTIQEGGDGRSIEIRVERSRVLLPTQLLDDGKTSGDPILDRYMADAVRALAAGNIAQAIVMLDRMLRMPPNAYSQQAKELMGVARERKGELERARLEYIEYLRMYRGTPGAKRVNERLSDLEMRRAGGGDGEPALVVGAAQEPDMLSGRWAQSYQHYRYDYQGSDPTRDTLLISTLNATLRGASEAATWLAYADAVQTHDVGARAREGVNVNAMYVQIDQKNALYGGIIGRQFDTESGIGGRFDGVLLHRRNSRGDEYRVAGGVPAEPVPGDARADRAAWGVSWRSGTLLRAVQSALWLGQQRIDGDVDRRTVGGNVRYTGETNSLNVTADYDLEFEAVNVLTLGVGRRIGLADRIDLTYDQRVTPVWQRSNALQDEDLDDYGDLDDWASGADILRKAALLPVETRRATLSLVKHWSERTWLFADVTATQSDARAEVPVFNDNAAVQTLAALPAAPREYFYTLQTVTSDVWMAGSSTSVGARASTGARRSTQSLFARTELPLQQRWRVAPRVQLDRTHTWSNDGEIMRGVFGAKLEYRIGDRVRLDAEAVVERADVRRGDPAAGYESASVFFGYRVDF